MSDEIVRGRRSTGIDGEIEVDAIAWPDGTFTLETRQHVHAWAPLGLGRRCRICGIEEFEIADERLRQALDLTPELRLVYGVRPLVDPTLREALG